MGQEYFVVAGLAALVSVLSAASAFYWSRKRRAVESTYRALLWNRAEEFKKFLSDEKSEWQPTLGRRYVELLENLLINDEQLRKAMLQFEDLTKTLNADVLAEDEIGVRSSKLVTLLENYRKIAETSELAIHKTFINTLTSYELLIRLREEVLERNQPKRP